MVIGLAKQKLMLLLGIVVIALIVVAYIGLTPSTNVGDDTTDDNSNVVDNNPEKSNHTGVDGNTRLWIIPTAQR